MAYNRFHGYSTAEWKKQIIQLMERYILADQGKRKSQDWRVWNLTELDDAHLINIYNICPFVSILNEISRRYTIYTSPTKA